jgi:hypothetical protein
MVRGKLIAAVLLTLVASRSEAQEHPHRNGEKSGTVHFATSCNDVAQKEFNRAVALTLIPLLGPPGLAALRAISERMSADSFMALALPPFKPPFRPIHAR